MWHLQGMWWPILKGYASKQSVIHPGSPLVILNFSHEIGRSMIMLLVLTYINNTSCKSAVRSLNDFIAYGQSKLANILHTNELSRIFKVSQVLSTLHTKECLMTEETMSIAWTGGRSEHFSQFSSSWSHRHEPFQGLWQDHHCRYLLKPK